MSPTCSEVLPHKVEQLLEGGDVQSLDSDSEEERLGEVHPLSQHPSQQVNLLSVLSLEKEEKICPYRQCFGSGFRGRLDPDPRT